MVPAPLAEEAHGSGCLALGPRGLGVSKGFRAWERKVSAFRGGRGGGLALSDTGEGGSQRSRSTHPSSCAEFKCGVWT